VVGLTGQERAGAGGCGPRVGSTRGSSPRTLIALTRSAT